MRFLGTPIKTAAAVAVVWTVTTGSVVNAQQRGTTTGTRGTTGTGSTTGTGTGSPTTGRSSTTGGQSGVLGGRSGTGTQGESLTGGGMGQPEFRPFGSTLNLNAAGIGGMGAADAFATQQRGGQQLGGQQALGLGTAQQFGGLGGMLLSGQAGGRGGLTPGTGQATTRSRAEQLRPRHRVAFPFSPASPTQLRTNLRVHLRPLQGRIRDAQYSLADDGTLTLRGTAASVDARELAEAVARLEPGVRRIDNQIVVPQAAAPSPQPLGGP